MPSSLSWVDYDPDERDRTTRILALFSERNARDELGLGGIRDAISDRLFPGTNTIQTRLRYVLLVPWVYQALEREETARANVGKEARKRELELIAPLLAGDDRSGVFGGRSGTDVQRLPSTVYWGGLGSWGIRRYEGSQDQYHRDFERIRARRRGSRRRDDSDHHDEPGPTWDPALPVAPQGFPNEVSLQLTHAEADYVRERIRFSRPASYLATLVSGDADHVDADSPWTHPAATETSDVNRRLLKHAHYFSEVMHGASLLYSLSLAEKKGLSDKVEEHQSRMEAWVDGLPELRAQAWDLEEFWSLTRDPHHTIHERARRFVESWATVAVSESLETALSPASRQLVQQREQHMKGARSRFVNSVALTQWNGDSGLRPMRFRWPTVQRFLADLRNTTEVE